ncbi:MAG: hypothetical protein F6J89_12590 [Symploca sp. SIO1C4]|uniref:Uncharacterized protein n=1 Tax=Symploca sp. SIO1C4 TaxID=2607765 RepID=A0A6B3N5M2_9CYAN|nr:hypothetical protein [Symploca sp. SIO1C4]
MREQAIYIITFTAELHYLLNMKVRENKGESTERATLHKALLTSGLVKHLKQPSYNQQTERRLIQVQGKPVSETIIEERR